MKIRRSGTSLQIETPAKVNLFLEILGRRADGFHQLQTVISTVSIFDSLHFSLRKDDKLVLRMRGQSAYTADIPTDSRNLIVRAIELVRDFASQSGRKTQLSGINIGCTKRIPSQAGLGGASGNAAGAIVAANLLWNCNFSKETCLDLCSRLGSDVPFFLTGGVAVCEGRGEIVTPVDFSAGQWLVIAKPPVGLSTASVFGKCSLPAQPESSEKLVGTIKTGRWNATGRLMFNRLQSFAGKLTDWIDRMKTSFERLHCLGHQMTGSGSSYFGLFANRVAAIRAASYLSNRHRHAQVYACRTLNPFRFCSVIG